MLTDVEKRRLLTTVYDRGVLLLAVARLGWLIFTFADVLASLARTSLPTTGSPLGRLERAGGREEHSRAEQSRAEQSRAEQRRAEHSRADESSFWNCLM